MYDDDIETYTYTYIHIHICLYIYMINMIKKFHHHYSPEYLLVNKKPNHHGEAHRHSEV